MNPATERAVYTFATPSLPAPASMPQRTPAVGNAHLITPACMAEAHVGATPWRPSNSAALLLCSAAAAVPDTL